MPEDEKVIGSPSSSFIQPKRRPVRQRSGFKVGGSKTGSECSIFKTCIYKITGKELVVSLTEEAVSFTKLFAENIYIYGLGLYIRSNKKILVSGSIEILGEYIDGKPLVENKDQIINAGVWSRFALRLDINDSIAKEKKYKVKIELKILSQTANPLVEVFGFQSGAVSFYFEKGDYKEHFYEKTELFEPEIYYLPFKNLEIKNIFFVKNGFLIGKSCNRCSRFLPIDIEKELNPMGFSNHCKKRAPCRHNAFSKYIIENPELITLLTKKTKQKVELNRGNSFLKSNFGFQLECRPCKKFVVNAPLNPLRNKAQHHEDGARRRALERMVIELTKSDIVKNYRIIHGIEFQDYIWEKFGKKCFACEKPLLKVSDMDIDHTFPLSYLWPLNETASCLCKTCNSQKHDLFPSEFSSYNIDKLNKLSNLTGIPLKDICNEKRKVNPFVLSILVKSTIWLFDNFLARDDYQKVKKGKKVSDLIYKALQKILTPEGIDLVQIYFEKTGKYPKSITLN